MGSKLDFIIKKSIGSIRWTFLFAFSSLTRGQADEEAAVIGLIARVERGAVSANFTAFGATVNDDEIMSRIGLGANGLHLSATGIGTVTGIDIHMKGPQAEGAMIPGAVSHGRYLFTAMGADKGAVVFCKSFLFHAFFSLRGALPKRPYPPPRRAV